MATSTCCPLPVRPRAELQPRIRPRYHARIQERVYLEMPEGGDQAYYDEQAERVSKNLLNGLTSIRHEHVDRLHRGLPLRGVRTELTIDPQGYIDEGDVFVFASVLNEFFALYASLNSYHELRVTSTQGDRYQWTPRMGLQPLL